MKWYAIFEQEGRIWVETTVADNREGAIDNFLSLRPLPTTSWVVIPEYMVGDVIRMLKTK